MRLLLLIFFTAIIGGASYFVFSSVEHVDPKLVDVDQDLALTLSDMEAKYNVWEQKVDLKVTPIIAKSVSSNGGGSVMPSDTILFLESFAVQQLGAEDYYNVLKPRLLARQKETGENPNHHMMMFFIESKFNTNAQNWQKNKRNNDKHLVAAGINQMTNIAIKDANQDGYLPDIRSLEHYLSMDLNTQLDYTFQHYDIFRRRYPNVSIDTPFKVYAVTFYPKAAVSSNHIIAKPNTLEARQNPGYVLKSGALKGHITKWSIKYYILKIITTATKEYHPEVQGQIKV